MKSNFTKKYLIAVVVGLVFLIGIPSLIYLLFRVDDYNKFLEVKLTLGEALGFYGSVLGGICTVLGVALTILYTQNQFSEEIRNRSLPFILVTLLETKFKFNVLPELQSESTKNETEDLEIEIGYKDYKLDSICIVLEGGKVEYKKRIPEPYKKLISNYGRKEVEKDGIINYIQCPFIYVPMELENVGNGSAINFRIGFNSISKKCLYTNPRNLKLGDIINIYLVSENSKEKSGEKNIGEYFFDIVYEDIYGNRYLQRYNVECDGKQMNFNLKSKQKIINKSVI